ncbi:SH2 domain-containing protein 3C [Protopterus annectens]|uniref:SH2 domain-containing protein 3C n=1 Tax=Protopterus annectens TaxID=7888 RepID=UPI001CFA8974|nr:SH2 domain-containing protein 3C [Protopterus annectens]
MNFKKLKFFKFKGFGSLGNIPWVFSRRSSTATCKADTEVSNEFQHHGSLQDDGMFKTVDDMDTAPRSPSYARSSDIVSHMGTMPRSNLRRKKKHSKKEKSSNETLNKKNYHKEMPLSTPSNPSLPDSLLPSPPNVSTCKDEASPTMKLNQNDDAPLQDPGMLSNAPVLGDQCHETQVQVTAANSLHMPRVAKQQSINTEEDGSAGTEKPVRSSSCEANANIHEEDDKKEMKRLPSQGPTSEAPEPIHESITKEQSDDRSMESYSDYVKFSKEKYILDSSPEKLRKELEEELRLNSSDLRSHGWYHGRIPREVAESLVQKNGDFLIRDSLTSLGDYVLTCHWKSDSLHFKINKVMLKPNEAYTCIQYLFEHESFDNIPALVHSYVGNRRIVSKQSGAVIWNPINRTLPLRYLEASYGLASGKHGLSHSPSSQKGGYIKRRSITMTDGLTTDKLTRSNAYPDSVSSTHTDVIRNCALSMDQIQDYRAPMSPISETPLSPAYSTVIKHKTQVSQVNGKATESPVARRSSEPQLCPANNNKTSTDSKSTAIPSQENAHSSPCHDYFHKSSSIQSYEEPENGHYCELQPPSPLNCDSPAKSLSKQNSLKSYVERLKVEEGQNVCTRQAETKFSFVDSGMHFSPTGSGKEVEMKGGVFVAPVVELTSTFKPKEFRSLLIPSDNKPLEMGALKKVKEILVDVDAKTTAMHMTKVDCQVARIIGVTKKMQKLMGVSSGLELLTLQHGHQLRLDLLERFHTMSIMIAVDILGCTGSTDERAALLHKTIQLAAELKSSMGNMFGFTAVMKALEMPQISRLEQTWTILRQRHTEGAVLYEKTLKPFLKNMNEGKESPPLTKTTYPHIIPLISLLERDTVFSEGPDPWESIENGAEIIMAHLEAARTVAHHGGLYRTNAEMKLQGFEPNEEVLEVFKTEFQMRLLWGSRGAEGNQVERYEKFDKVLTALSNKLEPPVRHSEL